MKLEGPQTIEFIMLCILRNERTQIKSSVFLSFPQPSMDQRESDLILGF